MTQNPDSISLLHDVIAMARRAGADAADALLLDGTTQSAAWRDGKVDYVEQSESSDIGLRIFVGKRQAIVSTTDRKTETLRELTSRAVAMAKASPEDPFCGLAEKEWLAPTTPTLTTSDATFLTSDQLTQLAKEGDEGARAVQGVTRTEGADASASRLTVTLATSHGFSGQYERTTYGLSVTALAGDGLEMEMESDYASRVYYQDLPPAWTIGQKAGTRAVTQRGGRKVSSCQVPVVFEPREAAGFLSILAGAISGPSIARGTSFLKNDLGKKIFSDTIDIIDDPFLPRGLRSRAFDSEGLLPQKRALVDKGVLQTWLLDCRSARQLGLKSTGHATRGTGGIPSPSPTNLYMANGTISVDDLIGDIESGLFVTGQMGDGVNGVTGDYSLAAKGYWIEKGRLTYPVNEITIAGNLRVLFTQMTQANDLRFDDGLNAPTLRIDQMTVAGA